MNPDTIGSTSKAIIKDASNVNCSSSSAAIFKKFGGVVESSLANWMQGLLSVSNIKKCISSSGEKLDKARTDKKGANKTCPPSMDLPTSNKIGDPAKNSASTPVYVLYPSMFDDKHAFRSPTLIVINWDQAIRTSVLDRWKPSAQAV